jgi:GTP cyclohydrolase IB
LRYPFQLRMDGTSGPTIGVWDLAVALPAEQKGTHMSRFVAWLDKLSLVLDLDTVLLRDQFEAMLMLLGAQEGRLEVSFPFFISKQAPVSGVSSLLDYQGGWVAEKIQEKTVVWTQVQVPVKSLCPCSKEISDYGAHNQRSHVTLRVELLNHVPWFELVRFAEDSASSEIWPMLKRLDEKWVTERAYDNPKFVEDLVRDVALRLNQDPRIGRYSVEVENFESIHNHSAYARIERME